METGTEANSVDALDAIHADVVAATGGAQAAPETSHAPGEIPTAQNGPAGGEGLDAEFCAEVLADTLEAHAQGTYDEFYEALKPHAGHDKADRIAKRAAMSQPTQRMVVANGTRVLKKYGADRYVGPEAALIVAALLYVRGLMGARKERDSILKGVLVQQGAG